MRIGPLEVKENGDKLVGRNVSLTDMAPPALIIFGAICLAIAGLVGWGLSVGIGGFLGLIGILSVTCGVLMSVTRRRPLEFASRNGWDRYVKGSLVPRTATAGVISSIRGFTACISGAKGTQVSLYTFRWRRDAEDLAIAVADFLDLKYISDPDPAMPALKTAEGVWPPPPRTQPQQPDHQTQESQP